ncbi:MAG TPA: endolytic transglycosylase MltG, partial [Streptosporangiaceae bacterium]|nr:endolytic transglycosylase MltG [Streptosporangiaceae bacterium]
GRAGGTGAYGESGSYGPSGSEGVSGSYGSGGGTGPTDSYGPAGSYSTEGSHGSLAGSYGPADSHGQNGSYGPPDPYGQGGSYGAADSYGSGRSGPADPHGGYGSPDPYGATESYGQSGSYGPPDSSGPGGSYGAQDGYGLPERYGPGGSSGPPDPEGRSGSYGQTEPFGASGSYGALGPAAGQADPADSTDSHGASDSLGQAGPGSSGSSFGPAGPYGQIDAYGQTEAYSQPGLNGQTGSYGQTGPNGRAGLNGQADSRGQTGLNGQTGAHRQGDQGRASDPGAIAGYRESGETDPGEQYAPSPYLQIESSSGTGSHEDSGSYSDTGSRRWDTGPRRWDSGSHGRETGSHGRPDSFTDTGPSADTGSYGRAEAFGDTGSHGLPGAYGDTGAHGRGGGRDQSDGYGQPDARGYDQPDGRGQASGPQSGTFRWPPPGSDEQGPAGRARDDSLPGRGSLPGARGYAEWNDEPGDRNGWQRHADDDDDWDDDDRDSGLLSRFGRGGGSKSGGRGGRGRGGRPRRLRGKVALLASVLAVALVLGVVASFGYDRIHNFWQNRYGDYTGPGTGVVKVTVPPGASLISLAPLLVRDGVIMAERPFISAANAAPNSSKLQPGTYKLHYHMSAALACNLLLDPKSRINAQVTIVEGTRASAIAALLASKTGEPVSAFLQIIKHPPAALGLPSWAGKTAEGYLFPDTYILLPHESPLKILQIMVSEFNQKVASIHLVSASARVFTTALHVLIVASMVQAEAGSVSDFPKISRVAWNRLKINMPLEFDSTVFYGLNKYGTAATKAETHIDTPYNTYLHTGLPPGPIGNPGLAAIEAALHPAKGNWLYFITDTRTKPYKTYYTSSLTQLQRWQQQFQG